MSENLVTLALRYQGLHELKGAENNPLIQGMIELVYTEMRGFGINHLPDVPFDDETAWCSAFMGFLCFNAGVLKRPSRSTDPNVRKLALRARSWLTVGEKVPSIREARQGFDVVILNRGSGEPDPTRLDMPGHVTLFMGLEANGTLFDAIGGNQSDRVKISRYHVGRILGIRRLA